MGGQSSGQQQQQPAKTAADRVGRYVGCIFIAESVAGISISTTTISADAGRSML